MGGNLGIAPGKACVECRELFASLKDQGMQRIGQLGIFGQFGQGINEPI